MARIIYTDGRQETVRPKNGMKFTLEELQAVVGGFVQVLELPSGELMWLNEEGKLYDLPENSAATVLARGAGIADDDWISGNVIITDMLETE